MDLRQQLEQAFFNWLNQPDGGESMEDLAAEGADTAWTVLQPVLDAKDKRIEALEVVRNASNAMRGVSELRAANQRQRAEQAEATNARVRTEGTIHAMAHLSPRGGCAACHMTAALDQPDQEGTP